MSPLAVLGRGYAVARDEDGPDLEELTRRRRRASG